MQYVADLEETMALILPLVILASGVLIAFILFLAIIIAALDVTEAIGD